MGNCLKGCLPRHNQGGCCSRRTARLTASDSQYEILIEGATDHHRCPEEQEHRGAIRSKATGKSKFFQKFWIRNPDVDYARLNKASNSNNNFTKRASSSTGRNAGASGRAADDGSGNSKHNQHAAAAVGFDIQLQCLDAHSLLLVSKDGARKAVNGQGCSSDLLQTDQTSSPGSSLDLEWENDYGGYPQAGCQWAFTQQQQQEETHGMASTTAAMAHLVSFPVAVQESVFKIEEWSMVKKSKDRINALRRLDHPTVTPSRGGGGDEVAGSLECLRRPLAPFERRSTLSLTSVERTEAYGGSSDLSHISSTPDGSLEWDIDQDRQLKSEHDGESEIDFETKELLLEIEQLKNRVLNETGASLRDDHAMIS
ncbi:uncharacterized protein LOC125949849 [Anopheles darlingi]|uniref:uncharacterized protein LOC125949849 n=1 Tax=Anopheles darlingi TaxID=43151 RepID=UPI0020FFF917|nr:uncharacterized protein LOC125949849 [Anopheles darlingi]